MSEGYNIDLVVLKAYLESNCFSKKLGSLDQARCPTTLDIQKRTMYVIKISNKPKKD